MVVFGLLSWDIIQYCLASCGERSRPYGNVPSNNFFLLVCSPYISHPTRPYPSFCLPRVPSALVAEITGQHARCCLLVLHCLNSFCWIESSSLLSILYVDLVGATLTYCNKNCIVQVKSKAFVTDPCFCICISIAHYRMPVDHVHVKCLRLR
jgi:hypothetical protein